MESIALASIVTSLIVKAAEKSGEKLGESLSGQVNEIAKVIRGKFQSKYNSEALKVLDGNHQSQEQEDIFQQMLETQIREDSNFRKRLTSIIENIQGDVDVQSEQIFLKDIFAKENIEIGEISQSVRAKHISYQEAATNIETHGTLRIKSMKQEA